MFQLFRLGADAACIQDSRARQAGHGIALTVHALREDVLTQRIEHLAEMASSLIQVQLVLASQPPHQAFKDHWALGYCWGLFDATSQRAKLDQYSEAILLAIVGFNSIVGGTWKLSDLSTLHHHFAGHELNSHKLANVIRPDRPDARSAACQHDASRSRVLETFWYFASALC